MIALASLAGALTPVDTPDPAWCMAALVAAGDLDVRAGDRVLLPGPPVRRRGGFHAQAVGIQQSHGRHDGGRLCGIPDGTSSLHAHGRGCAELWRVYRMLASLLCACTPRNCGSVAVHAHPFLSLIVAVACAQGKVVWGYATDKLGGRFALAVCMAGSGLASIMFGFSRSYELFVLWWAVLRFMQPAGWPGVVKIAGAWVPWKRTGLVMGILSLSFLVGESHRCLQASRTVFTAYSPIPGSRPSPLWWCGRR